MALTARPGGSLESLFEDPEAIAAFTRPTPFEVPDTMGARGRFRDLQTQSISGLEELLAGGGAKRRPEIEEELYNRQAEDINRASDRTRSMEREGTFGRGVGVSSITNDRLADVDRERNDSLGRARREAILGASAEARAEEAARLAALGQGYTTGTGGMQSEANIFFNNAQAEADANKYGVGVGSTNLTNRLAREQQGGQFGAELASREELERERRGLTREISRDQLLAGGIGAGIGGLAGLFRG